MIHWTEELRYQSYEKWDKNYVHHLKKQLNTSSWRFSYHIQPESGLLNDPNGFSFFNNQWHVFYQAYPFGPVHGLKSWYHMYSENLVDWTRDKIRLEPDTLYDSHGVYSGSALPINDQLFLAYTGNVRDQNWERHAYQMGAFMNKEFQVTKEDHPFIVEPPKGYTHHFRDPQVFLYKENYYLIIGAQTEQEQGKILLYAGKNLTDWTFMNELTFTNENLGYMIECPNLVFINEQPLLIFCPQGMDKQIANYQNIYPNMYLTAKEFQPETAELLQPSHLKNLDDGFDVYATQAFTAPDGRTLAIGWVGLPDVTYPSDSENWAHCLTLVRELTLRNGQLFQQPVDEQKQLRQAPLFEHQINAENQLVIEPENNCYEVEIILDKDQVGTLTLCSNRQTKQGLQIHFDTKNGTLLVDRGQMKRLVNTDYGTTRSISLDKHQSLHLQIFIDHSICEIFVNKGEHVLTSRIFPDQQDTTILLERTLDFTIWPLRAMHSKE